MKEEKKETKKDMKEDRAEDKKPSGRPSSKMAPFKAGERFSGGRRSKSGRGR